jgi:hypothetical protein
MEKKQLVTIAITAVTSVIAKEVLSWFVALVRSSAQTDTARQKARTIFSKNNLQTIAAFAWLIFTGFSLWYKLHETTPITRYTIAWVVISMFNFFFAFCFSSFALSNLIYDRKRSKTPLA